MASNGNTRDVGNDVETGAKSIRPTLNPLHEAAMRLAGVGMGVTRSRAKTKDLINLLLCHGARAWRQSQPAAGIHLHVTRTGGRYPVILKTR